MAKQIAKKRPKKSNPKDRSYANKSKSQDYAIKNEPKGKSSAKELGGRKKK